MSLEASSVNIGIGSIVSDLETRGRKCRSWVVTVSRRYLPPGLLASSTTPYSALSPEQLTGLSKMQSRSTSLF